MMKSILHREQGITLPKDFLRQYNQYETHPSYCTNVPRRPRYILLHPAQSTIRPTMRARTTKLLSSPTTTPSPCPSIGLAASTTSVVKFSRILSKLHTNVATTDQKKIIKNGRAQPVYECLLP